MTADSAMLTIHKNHHKQEKDYSFPIHLCQDPSQAVVAISGYIRLTKPTWKHNMDFCKDIKYRQNAKCGRANLECQHSQHWEVWDQPGLQETLTLKKKTDLLVQHQTDPQHLEK